MPFNKHWTLTTAFTVTLLAASLTACTTAPSGPPPERAPSEIEHGPEPEDLPPGLDWTAPERNPYLATQRDAPEEAIRAFERAVESMQNKLWEDAEISLQWIVQNHPDLSGPWLNLGIVYRQLGQLEQAQAAFNKAIEVNTLNLDAYNQLALLKREAGDFTGAEQLYLAAIGVWPKHPASHRNIGILYDLYMGELSKALQHFEIYQYLQKEADRQVSGWIVDLNRRINEAEAAQAQVQP